MHRNSTSSRRSASATRTLLARRSREAAKAAWVHVAAIALITVPLSAQRTPVTGVRAFASVNQLHEVMILARIRCRVRRQRELPRNDKGWTAARNQALPAGRSRQPADARHPCARQGSMDEDVAGARRRGRPCRDGDGEEGRQGARGCDRLDHGRVRGVPSPVPRSGPSDGCAGEVIRITSSSFRPSTHTSVACREGPRLVPESVGTNSCTP